MHLKALLLPFRENFRPHALWILQIYAGKSATLRPREMDSGTISFAKISNPRYGSLLGRGCVPLDEIYVAVPLRVGRSEFSLYP